jgi:hypothetical protein
MLEKWDELIVSSITHVLCEFDLLHSMNPKPWDVDDWIS